MKEKWKKGKEKILIMIEQNNSQNKQEQNERKPVYDQFKDNKKKIRKNLYWIFCGVEMLSIFAIFYYRTSISNFKFFLLMLIFVLSQSLTQYL